MARRTKEDALATRHSLLDAAERVFQAKGVARATLGDIAAAAGTTRGAIYWHFADKSDLFNAMMERVVLPMERGLEAATLDQADPLPALHATLLGALDNIATDPQLHRVLEIATLKVEYVDDLWAIRQHHLRTRDEWVARMTRVLRASARHRGLCLPLPVEAAARGLHALVSGIIQSWLLDPSAFDLRACGAKAIQVYLAGLGLPADPPASRARSAARR
ncbi:MAG: TetR family transcriptional regulator [Ramlibacter sp.]|nr:TetR family transcriptional regulator [Ramlibacter sp.]